MRLKLRATLRVQQACEGAKAGTVCVGRSGGFIVLDCVAQNLSMWRM